MLVQSLGKLSTHFLGLAPISDNDGVLNLSFCVKNEHKFPNSENNSTSDIYWYINGAVQILKIWLTQSRAMTAIFVLHSRAKSHMDDYVC